MMYDVLRYDASVMPHMCVILAVIVIVIKLNQHIGNIWYILCMCMIGDAVSHLFIPHLITLNQQGRFPYEKLITYYDNGNVACGQCGLSMWMFM